MALSLPFPSPTSLLFFIFIFFRPREGFSLKLMAWTRTRLCYVEISYQTSSGFYQGVERIVDV